MLPNKRKSFSLIAFFAVCLFMPVCAFSAPFLTCDPQVGVTHYEVSVAGKTEVVSAGADSCLWYDLAAFAVGEYHFEVKAMRITETSWGVSTPSPFIGTCVPLVPVSGLSVLNK